MVNVNNQIRHFRELIGLNQGQFAIACGWTGPRRASRIWNYEQGNRMPCLDDARKIVSAFQERLPGHITLDEVFPPTVEDDSGSVAKETVRVTDNQHLRPML